MPRISTFYGIVIRMYWNERDHPIAHFHAEYDGQRAALAIDGRVLAGSLAPRPLRLARKWAGLHSEELLANWERARQHKPLTPIDPLP